MERKIGEIFEYNGEWYQCIRSILTCSSCEIPRPCTKIRELGYCSPNMRNDKEQVVFKKLEKDGEPYEFDGYLFQSYRTFEVPIFTENYATVRESGNNSKISIEIKQTKEDMEEKKQKLDDLVGLYSSAKMTYKEFYKELKALYVEQEKENKPVLKTFDLEAAKAGKPVCTRDGRKARIICFDIKDKDNPIAAAVFVGVCESVYLYTNKGEYNKGKEDGLDLMMLPEKHEGYANIVKEEHSDDRVVLGRIFDSYEDAFRSGKANERYIATVKIEWTE